MPVPVAEVTRNHYQPDISSDSALMMEEILEKTASLKRQKSLEYISGIADARERFSQEVWVTKEKSYRVTEDEIAVEVTQFSSASVSAESSSDEMPTASGARPWSVGRKSATTTPTSGRSSSKKKKKRTGSSTSEKVSGQFNNPRVPEATSLTDTLSQGASLESALLELEAETEDTRLGEEYSMQKQLIPVMREISRQKIRSVQMMMRRIAAAEGTITSKDVTTILQDTKINIGNRLLQMLLNECETKKGVDHDRFFRYMENAHSKSGRDSVDAAINEEGGSAAQLQDEERDKELLRRSIEQFNRSTIYFDLEAFKALLAAKDVERNGKVAKDMVLDACAVHYCPVYGALLHSLLNRCDQERNGMISWWDFSHFLERARKFVMENNPNAPKPDSIPKKGDPNFHQPKIVVSAEAKASVRSKLKSMASRAKSPTPRKSDSNDDEPRPNGEEKKKEENGNDYELTKAERPKTIPLGKDLPKPPPSDPPATVAPTTSLRSKLLKVGLKGRAKNKTAAVLVESAEAKRKAAEAAEAEKKRKAEEEAAERKRKEEAERERRMAEEAGRFQFDISDTVKSASQKSDALELPDVRLRLSWAYGCRGNDCRNNIRLLASGELLYHTGHVVVMFNMEKYSQRHYTEHSGEVRSICINADGVTVASGQKAVTGTKEVIRVWRADNFAEVCVLKASLVNAAIVGLAFPRRLKSADGRIASASRPAYLDILLSLDDSMEHRITMWDTKKGESLAILSTSTEMISACDISPKDPNLLVTIGKEHIRWWQFFPEDKALQMKCEADHQTFLKAKYTISLLHRENGELITGDSNGTVYIWTTGANTIRNYIKHAHSGPVFSLCLYKNLLLTGGRDHMIYAWQWGKNMDKVGHFAIPPVEGAVRSMLVVGENHLVLSTTSNSMLFLELNTEGPVFEDVVLTTSSLLTQGHFDRLTALSLVPAGSSWFMTAGYDSQVCVFDAATRKGLQKTSLNRRCITAAFWHPRDGRIVMALWDHKTNAAECLILSQTGVDLHELCRKALGNSKVRCVTTHDESETVCFGCANGRIVLVREEKNEKGDTQWTERVVKVHDMPVSSIDVTVGAVSETCLIRTTTQAGEFKLHRFSNLEEVTLGSGPGHLSTKDIQWASETALIHGPIAGIWKASVLREDVVTSVSINHKHSIIAVGTLSGFIYIFRYPCLEGKAFCHKAKAIRPVLQLKFTHDENYLIGIGGEDATILQWSIV